MSGYGVNICISADLNYINFSPCPTYLNLINILSQLYKVIQLSDKYYTSSSKFLRLCLTNQSFIVDI